MCRLMDLKNKEVINIVTGKRMGFVCDIIFSLTDGHFLSLVVPGKKVFRFFFSKYEDIIIPWENIVKIGDDIILVKYCDISGNECINN